MSSRFFNLVVIAVFTLTTSVSFAQGLQHHAQLSHAPLISLQAQGLPRANDSLDVDREIVVISRQSQTMMVLDGMGGVLGGTLLAIASSFFWGSVSNDWSAAPISGMIFTGLVAIPVSTAAAVHSGQSDKPYKSKFSCTLSGSAIGFAGGLLLSPITLGVSFFAGPAYGAMRSYKRCAYYLEGKNATTEDSKEELETETDVGMELLDQTNG